MQTVKFINLFIGLCISVIVLAGLLLSFNLVTYDIDNYTLPQNSLTTDQDSVKIYNVNNIILKNVGFDQAIIDLKINTNQEIIKIFFNDRSFVPDSKNNIEIQKINLSRKEEQSIVIFTNYNSKNIPNFRIISNKGKSISHNYYQTIKNFLIVIMIFSFITFYYSQFTNKSIKNECNTIINERLKNIVENYDKDIDRFLKDLDIGQLKFIIHQQKNGLIGDDLRIKLEKRIKEDAQATKNFIDEVLERTKVNIDAVIDKYSSVELMNLKKLNEIDLESLNKLDIQILNKIILNAIEEDPFLKGYRAPEPRKEKDELIVITKATLSES